MVAVASRRLVIDSSDEDGDEDVEFVSELINGLNVDDDPSGPSTSSSDAESADVCDDKNVAVGKKTLMPHQRTGVDWLLNL